MPRVRFNILPDFDHVTKYDELARLQLRYVRFSLVKTGFFNHNFHDLHSQAKNSNLKKVEFICNKPSKLWKLNFGNNLSEKRICTTNHYYYYEDIYYNFSKKRICILLLRDKLGSETHVMINATKANWNTP